MANSLREGGEYKSIHVLIEGDVSNIKGSCKHKFRRGQNSKLSYFRCNHRICFFASRTNRLLCSLSGCNHFGLPKSLRKHRGKLGNWKVKKSLQTPSVAG